MRWHRCKRHRWDSRRHGQPDQGHRWPSSHSKDPERRCLRNSYSPSDMTLDPERVWRARGMFRWSLSVAATIRARTETARRVMPVPTKSEAKERCRSARPKIETTWLFVMSSFRQRYERVGTSMSLLPKDIQGRSSRICLLLGCWQVNVHGPCASSIDHRPALKSAPLHCTPL